MSRLTELYDIYKKQGTAQRDADVAASGKVYGSAAFLCEQQE